MLSFRVIPELIVFASGWEKERWSQQVFMLELTISPTTPM